jgi:glycosyltransferase involved in cell wall biosynthesis
MLTLVIPVYKNEASLPDLVKAVQWIAGQIDEAFEAVFVVDGSPDQSFARLQSLLADGRFAARLILLSRNFGAFAAIRAGLEHGRGDRLAVMAADLQEPPELVVAMNRALRDEMVDVIVGVRDGRSDPLFSRMASALFWSLYRRFVMPQIPKGGVDIFACNRRFADALLTLEEQHSSLIAQIFWLGFRRRELRYERRARAHGVSAWTFRKKLNYMLDSVFAFTDLPIRWLLWGGATVAAFSICMGVLVGLLRAFGAIDVPGYAMTLIVIVILGAANLFGLGVVGSYAWRAFENGKRRPLSVPMVVLEYGVKESA